MAYFYGMVRLGAAEQWRGLAGEAKWVPTRSAYELAYAWHGANGVPPGIAAALSDSGVPELARLRLEVGVVEKPSYLDTPIGPSMTDIMGYARNAAGDPVVVAVEGKATESFGLPVRAWVRGDLPQPSADTEPRPSRVRRLRYLAERLGIDADAESALHYQLLHRTVAGVNEAMLYGADVAVLLVHSFAPDDEPNWAAYEAFLAAMGAPGPRKGAVSGPLTLPSAPGVRLYALWYQDRPRLAAT